MVPDRSGNEEHMTDRRGHLQLARGNADSRLFVHLLPNFIHRADHARRGLYGGDLDLAAVGETVAMVAIEPAMRDLAFRQTFHDLPSMIGLERQQAVNALTIAEATGIPRETVRRKLKQLLELGLITEKGRGRYVIKPGMPQQPENLAAAESAMRDTLQFMNDCLSLGLVRWVDRPRE
jgi:DNA-binding transcriptional regulator YhcF (GntR family)